MSGDFSADRLSATIPTITDSERAMATLCLSRHDADDLIEMLGLDLPQPEREDVDRSRPRHHQNHILASARRIA
jgi:hypothetical protein